METQRSNLDRNTDHRPIRLTPKYIQAVSTPLFPRKLHLMLHKCKSEGKENIFSWVSNGRAFKVHNIPVFVSEILPSYFKQTKYKSFQRQLNLWGFERILTGAEKGAYHNEDFLQRSPNLCSRLKRRGYSKADSMKATALTTNSFIPSQVSPIQRPQMTETTTRVNSYIPNQVLPIQRPQIMKITTRNDARIPSQVLPGVMLPLQRPQIMETTRNDTFLSSQILPLQRPQTIEMTINDTCVPSRVSPLPSQPRNCMTRKVSEGSLDAFESLCEKIDTNISEEELELADFEGVSFYLLDEKRYEELNREFCLSRYPEKETFANRPSMLLEQLEMGYFGTLRSELKT